MTSLTELDEITYGMKNMSMRNKTSIFCFARMNPPHQGHGKLIAAMLGIQKSLKKQGADADVHILLQSKSNLPSMKAAKKTDPLSFDVRKKIITNYIQYSFRKSMNDIYIESHNTAQYAFDQLIQKGYNRFYFIMGKDRKDAFSSPSANPSGYVPMYKHVEKEREVNGETIKINWAKVTIEGNDFLTQEGLFQNGHQIQLKGFDRDFLLTTYENMEFPIINDKEIVAIINPRANEKYTLQDLDKEIKDRNRTSISATETREIINAFQFDRDYDIPKSRPKKADMYDYYYNHRTKSGHFREIINLLMPQGLIKGTSPVHRKALMIKMIMDIKSSLSTGGNSLYEKVGAWSSTKAARRSRGESLRVKRSLQKNEPNKLNVLSYNVCWECTVPIDRDWNETTNWYEKDIKQGWIKKEDSSQKREAQMKIYKGDSDHGLGYMCQKDPQRCRVNIGSIIENSIYPDPYDLVGMQEFELESSNLRWDNHPYFEIRKHIVPMKLRRFDKSDKSNPKYAFILDDNGEPKSKKITIASLYNKNTFIEISKPVGGQFMAFKEPDPDNVWKDGDEGRPFIILHLRHKRTRQEILFINAHMPQTNSIQQPIEHNIVGPIEKAIENLENKPRTGARIILTTDSNDFENKFVTKLVIKGKFLNHGANYKETCCTTVVKPINNKGRDDRRVRFGDIILDTLDKNNSFKYDYPPERQNEPYSDHAPIATQLSVVNLQSVTGGKKRTRRRKRKRTRRKKKRKRRRTKKKRKKRRKRKRTKRR